MANQAPQTAKGRQASTLFEKGLTNVLDLVAPAGLKLDPNYLQIGEIYVKTLFVYTYPEYVQTNWLTPIINYDIAADISMFIYPMESALVMQRLRKKVAQLESSMSIEKEKGLVRNPELESAVENIEVMRDALQKGAARLYQFGLYITVYAKSLEEMNLIVKQLESTLGGLLIYSKQALLQMEQGFISCLPLGLDQLQILRNLDTASLSTTFPFVSSELSSGEGILYGINRHNNSLIIFDRFALENANSVIFAKAGAGKSYAVKLEILRSLMLGTDIMVVDPENEYINMAQELGGSTFNLSLQSDQRINPFDLPQVLEEGETGQDALRATITSVKGLIRLMLGGLTPEEDSVLDKAIYETYAIKDITADPATFKNSPPLLSDLQTVMQNMTGTESMVQRMLKFTEGTFAGLLNQPTNFKIDNKFMVLSIRDLEEELRPIGMYLILNYIWNEVRRELKKRILVIDEAWWLMQYEDSARFLYGLAKRARKYYLGLTVISQDVEDFLESSKGRAVINNSSLQLLLKQSTAAVDKAAEIFNLTEGEKFLLLEADIGEGLFFAGQNHVAIKVVASPQEDVLISTNPAEMVAKKQEEKESEENRPAENEINADENKIAENIQPLPEEKDETPPTATPVEQPLKVEENQGEIKEDNTDQAPLASPATNVPIQKEPEQNSNNQSIPINVGAAEKTPTNDVKQVTVTEG